MKFKLINKKITVLSLMIAFCITMILFILIPNSVKAATIVLPTGSTANQLQSAVDNSSPGDVIVISSNITLNSNAGIWLTNGKDITIRSNEGNNWTLFQRQLDMYHFHVDRGCSLILENITIDGGGTGGIVYVYRGNLTLNDNVIVQNCVWSSVGAGLAIFNNSTATMNGNSIVRNCSGLRGGGAYVSPGSTFTMNDDSIITNCSTTPGTSSVGGGVCINESTFIMNDNATITECSSSIAGGGLYINDGTFIMNGGNITKNTSNLGAGVYAHIGTATIENATISENIANTNGGGIYLTRNGSIENIKNSSIINNSAQKGNGGVIYTQDIEYRNIFTKNSTIFDDNTASVQEVPPRDAEILYPNIKFASTSISTHPLNNYDINYEAVYSIIYDANGGTGAHTVSDITPGSEITVLSSEDTEIERTNYSFIGWNTSQDGSGDTYQPGDTITVNDDVILYAQWEFTGEYTVSFESNGGTPIDYQTVPNGETATKPEDPTRKCYIFKGWYTDDGTFENEWDFNTSITEDMTLYAKWNENPCCNPCIWILILMFTIMVVVIVFCKEILRIIKCIICKIKKWISCLKCKCKNKCKK